MNHNHITDEQTDFMVRNQLEMIKENDDVEFMAYNPNLIFDSNNDVEKHTICLNDKKVMRFLDSKISFRKFSEKYVHTLHSELLTGADCRYNKLCQKFSQYNKWIVQSDVASGGYETFILGQENEKRVTERLNDTKEYLVSPYYEANIPINIHAVIYEKEVLFTQGSIQVMELDGERILYRGADYIAYRKIESHIIKQFTKDVEILCKDIPSYRIRPGRDPP